MLYFIIDSLNIVDIVVVQNTTVVFDEVTGSADDVTQVFDDVDVVVHGVIARYLVV